MPNTKRMLKTLSSLLGVTGASLLLAACTTDQDINQVSVSSTALSSTSSKDSGNITLASVYQIFEPKNAKQATLYLSRLQGKIQEINAKTESGKELPTQEQRELDILTEVVKIYSEKEAEYKKALSVSETENETTTETANTGEAANRETLVGDDPLAESTQTSNTSTAADPEEASPLDVEEKSKSDVEESKTSKETVTSDPPEAAKSGESKGSEDLGETADQGNTNSSTTNQTNSTEPQEPSKDVVNSSSQDETSVEKVEEKSLEETDKTSSLTQQAPEVAAQQSSGEEGKEGSNDDAVGQTGNSSSSQQGESPSPTVNEVSNVAGGSDFGTPPSTDTGVESGGSLAPVAGSETGENSGSDSSDDLGSGSLGADTVASGTAVEETGVTSGAAVTDELGADKGLNGEESVDNDSKDPPKEENSIDQPPQALPATGEQLGAVEQPEGEQPAAAQPVSTTSSPLPTESQTLESRQDQEESKKDEEEAAKEEETHRTEIVEESGLQSTEEKQDKKEIKKEENEQEGNGEQEEENTRQEGVEHSATALSASESSETSLGVTLTEDGESESESTDDETIVNQAFAQAETQANLIKATANQAIVNSVSNNYATALAHTDLLQITNLVTNINSLLSVNVDGVSVSLANQGLFQNQTDLNLSNLAVAYKQGTQTYYVSFDFGTTSTKEDKENKVKTNRTGATLGYKQNFADFDFSVLGSFAVGNSDVTSKINLTDIGLTYAPSYKLKHTSYQVAALVSKAYQQDENVSLLVTSGLYAGQTLINGVKLNFGDYNVTTQKHSLNKVGFIAAAGFNYANLFNVQGLSFAADLGVVQDLFKSKDKIAIVADQASVKVPDALNRTTIKGGVTLTQQLGAFYLQAGTQLFHNASTYKSYRVVFGGRF